MTPFVLLLNAGHDDYARRFEDYPPLQQAYYAGALTAAGIPWRFVDAARDQRHHRLYGEPWQWDERPVYRYGMADDELTAYLQERFGAGLPLVSAVVVTTGLSWAWPAIAGACRAVRRVSSRVPVYAGGPYPTLCPGDAVRRLVDAELADDVLVGLGTAELLARVAPDVPRGSFGEVSWPAGAHPRPDPVVAGEATTWTAAVLASLSDGITWSTGLDQPIYGWGLSGQGIDDELVAWRPTADVIAECLERVERGYRRFVWWDLDTLRDGGLPFGHVVEAVWRSPAVASLTTSHKLRWFLTTAARPETITKATAWVLRKARVPHVRIRLDRWRRDEAEELARCADAAAALATEGFTCRELAVMVETAFPGDTYERAAGIVRACLRAGLSPRLQAWAPLPGSAGWDELAQWTPVGGDSPRLGAGLSKWLPGCWRNEAFTTAQFKRLHTLAYHARELLRAGVDPLWLGEPAQAGA